MSESGKSVKPIRQLSLQPPAPCRQQIRRQRSAEDDKSLQICASPLARGKRGTSGKSGFERPKVRVAWTDNRRKNAKEPEQVEVVARQMPGRSRPATGRSRGFAGIEKPTILYSRQELAERLRLAWKHREENKANINIFLAHGTLEKRCDSEMSMTITAPPSPLSKSDTAKLEVSLASNCEETQDETCFHENCMVKEIDKTNIVIKKSSPLENGSLLKNCQELSEFGELCSERQAEALEEEKMSKRKASVVEDTPINEQLSKNSNVDECPNSKNRDSSAALPSIKTDQNCHSTSNVTRTSKEDFSSAKQKRASFHSGTNRAFLGPVRSTTEFKWNPVEENTAPKPEVKSPESKDNVNKTIIQRSTSEVKYSSATEKLVTQKSLDSKFSSTEKNPRTRTTAEKDKDIQDKGYSDDKMVVQRAINSDKVVSIKRSTSSTVEKEGSTIDEIAFARFILKERCSSVIEKNLSSRKPTEPQKVDQKSRRTSSAPPQRHLGNATNNRVQVNIVIDAPILSGAKSDKEKSVDCKDNVDRTDATKTQVSTGRSIRSAPLKRRSRSAKRRLWGKNDEDGKSRNRSAGSGKNSVDSKAIDIVTMVSLVSSADSDSDTENSPGDDKLIDELRSKLPTTSIIKTTNPMSIARRPIKSVSFQRDSFDEDPTKEQQPPAKEERKTTTGRLAIVNHRGNGSTLSGDETVPWRTDIPGLALPILALIHDAEDTVDVPLTDREKRCLAVPIGDLHDKKRKLLKTRSTPPRSAVEKQIPSKPKLQDSPRIVPPKMETPVQQFKPSTNSPPNVKQAFATATKETAQQVQPMPTEPQFQTNKEKECWHLYRKMCDKGVCVSFDTVLRGMLTPTEYRLRQRELFQDS